MQEKNPDNYQMPDTFSKTIIVWFPGETRSYNLTYWFEYPNEETYYIFRHLMPFSPSGETDYDVHKNSDDEYTLVFKSGITLAQSIEQMDFEDQLMDQIHRGGTDNMSWILPFWFDEFQIQKRYGVKFDWKRMLEYARDQNERKDDPDDTNYNIITAPRTIRYLASKIKREKGSKFRGYFPLQDLH
jgi:hypothetical protein